MTTAPEEIIDLIAVQRVVDGRGHHTLLNLDEKRRAALLLTADGHSSSDIARRLGVAQRTIVRWRSARALLVTPDPGSDRWQYDAACREYDASLFFPPEDDGRLQSYSEAKRICAACPVREKCLEAAMAREGNSGHHYRAGLWGGLTPNQRAALFAIRQKEAAA